MQKTKITCKKCKGSRQVFINGNKILWDDHVTNPRVAKIISGRKRLDGQFGWECICGTRDIMTKQEQRAISDPTNPEAEELKTIVDNLKPDKPKFVMEAI